MLGLIPSKQQWKAWSLPSKLTAIGTLVGVLSFCFYVFEKGYSFAESSSVFSASNDVLVEVELNNQTKELLSLYGRGEVFYWYPNSAQYASSAFEIVQGDNVGANLSITPDTKVRTEVRLLPKDVASEFLAQGHMTLSLMFKGSGGYAHMSRPVGFSEANISGGYIEVIFGEEKS
ncbi:hypothetical protein ABV436_000436 [Vibrio parahaemolyticus]|uniref:hypothetical protein n=1 Tax=Vibrio parahaemolyticus TaxID=670 RepID=UPI0004DA09E9|nr:hypothetical protein [Vibrio parahaemolyticus]OOI04114.1 hypothetical protein BIW16_07950 [Vibrio sp. OULL4]EJG1646726.1 hypothetical protein [Vibrio parahaemolyticus]EMA2530665.1 hypothetical protein [Vibrio parahaemolyticus]KOF37455.1 hypothetical protein ACX04_00225 [Vibrio parahaemolyticus]MBE3981243.1 hypothetical protein [Vibrio parahaemolyticus]